MAMHAGEIAKLADIDLKNFGRARRSEIDCSVSLCAKRFIPKSTTTIAVGAFVSLLGVGFFSCEIRRKPEADNARSRNRI